jgi:hypothetical protein
MRLLLMTPVDTCTRPRVTVDWAAHLHAQPSGARASTRLPLPPTSPHPRCVAFRARARRRANTRAFACWLLQEYGKVRLWGAVGWGVVSSIAGAVVSTFGMGYGFCMQALLALPVVVVAAGMDLKRAAPVAGVKVGAAGGAWRARLASCDGRWGQRAWNDGGHCMGRRMAVDGPWADRQGMGQVGECGRG